MKNIVLLYNECCVYEIVILNYFLKFTNCDVTFCSLGDKTITSMEGYSLNVDKTLAEIDLQDVRTLVIPGGTIASIDNAPVWEVIQRLHAQNALVAAICAGVDVLDHAGILKGIRSTHSTDEDCVRDGNVITSRANGYVDFAIETAKALDLFEDETDLQETIDFWKNYKRMQ